MTLTPFERLLTEPYIFRIEREDTRPSTSGSYAGQWRCSVGFVGGLHGEGEGYTMQDAIAHALKAAGIAEE